MIFSDTQENLTSFMIRAAQELFDGRELLEDLLDEIEYDLRTHGGDQFINLTKPIFDEDNLPDEMQLGPFTWPITRFRRQNRRIELGRPSVDISQIEAPRSESGRGQGLFLTQDTYQLTFTRRGRPVGFRLTGNETGKRLFGWSGAEGSLTTEFVDLLDITRTVRFPLSIDDNTDFKSLTELAAFRDFDNNTYGLRLGSSENKNIEFGALTSVTIGGTSYTLNNPSFYKEGSIFITEFEINEAFYNLLKNQAEDLTAPLTVSFSEAFDFGSASVEYVPIYGFSRGSYKYNIADNETRIIRRAAGAAAPLLEDSGFFLACGFHLIFPADETVKITPFVSVLKTSTLASSTSLVANIGGTEYTLTPHTVAVGESSDIVQEFRLSDEDALTSVQGLPLTEDFTFTLTDDQSKSYQFKDAKEAIIRSNVRCECLIFELGSPSGAQLNNKRVIGGNNYDLTHTEVSRLICGYSGGFSAAALVNQDSYVATENNIFKLFSNVQIGSNNIIARLVAPATDEARRLLALSQVSLENLALAAIAGSDEVLTPADDVSIFNNFFTVKSSNYANIEDNASYSAIIAYLDAEYTRSSDIKYNDTLTDVFGRGLKPISLTSGFSGQAVYLNSSEGVFVVGPELLTTPLNNIKALSDIVVLNNKIRYLTEDFTIASLVASEERRGFETEFYGLLQTGLLEGTTQTLFDPVTKAYYFLNGNRIVRALDYDKRLVGWSDWRFRDENDVQKAEPKFLFFSNNVLHALFTAGQSTFIAAAENEQAVDFPDSTLAYNFPMILYSNPLIFASVAGFDGSVSLTSIKKIALFETGLNNCVLGFSSDMLEAANTPLPLMQYRTGQPIEVLENELLERGFIVLQQIGADTTGVLKGFQARGTIEAGAK